MSKKSNIPDKKQNQEIVIPQQLEKQLELADGLVHHLKN